MAYNKKNYYERIVDIQNIVKEHQKKGATLIWIYNNQIKETYRISYSTFSNYLGISAAKELKKINKKNQGNENN
jgi:hypothetical protein